MPDKSQIPNPKSKILLLAGILAICACFGLAKSAQAQSYYAAGVLQSENVLSGADITDINDFRVTAQIPASTTVSLSFSQDRNFYYSASGTKGDWTEVASGTSIIDLSELSWTGALLFYKLKLATTDASSTPVVGEIRVNYDGTEVPAATSTRYGRWGILASDNMLAGAEVEAVTGFAATTSLPSGSVARISFSQDKSAFYSASGTKGAWTDLADGGNVLDLTGLDWSAASLYYKIRLEVMIDPAVQPKITEARVLYEGTAAPVLSGLGRNWSGVLLSTDLLASSTETFSGTEHFGYTISYLPYGASVRAQFSRDGTTFYSSTGQAWAWDDLSAGNNRSLSLASLDWGGTESFYYKLKFDLSIDNHFSPVLKQVGLYSYSAMMTGPAGAGYAVQMGTSSKYCVPGDTAYCAGPVLELNFDEFAGTTTYDTSGQGNDGVFVSQASSPEWERVGKVGHALRFDGEDDYIDISNFMGAANPEPFTACAWFKPNTLHTGSIWTLLDEVDGGDYNKNYELNVLSGGTVEANKEGYGAESATTYSPGEWNYVCGVYNASNERFVYLNAGGMGIDTTTRGAETLDTMSIGVRSFIPKDKYFNGLIDHVKIYNYARTPAQIAWDYNKGKPIAHWKFDECQGSTIHDESGNGNHGQLYLGDSGVTATGTCASSSDSFWYNGRAGKYNSSGSFDGEDDYIGIGDTNLDINTVAFWLKPDSTTENIIDLDGGTHYIVITAGVVSAPGFDNPAIFIDGQTGATVDTDWRHVTVKTGTAFEASNVTVGKRGANYYDGLIDEVKIYNYALTAEQVKTEYAGGAVRFGN